MHGRNSNLGIQSLSCCDSYPLAPYLAHQLALALYGDVAVGGVHKGYDDLLLAPFLRLKLLRINVIGICHLKLTGDIIGDKRTIFARFQPCAALAG